MNLIHSSWLSMVLGSLLYLGMTGYLLRPANLIKNGIQAAGGGRPAEANASWDFFNPEVDRLVTELRKEKAAVQQREQQLNELAARLEAERAEITIVTQAVSRLQREFDQNVVRVQEQEMANLKKLAKVYAAMDASAAATIFKQMEDDQMVKIMVFMKDGETAPVLENLARLGEADAKRVALITERLRTSIAPKAPVKP